MKRRFIIRAAAAFCAALFACSGTAAAKNVQYTYDYGDYEGVFTVDRMEFLSKEILPWAGDGCGIHYTMRFAVTEETVHHISVGNSLYNVNNADPIEDPILEDRWCKITVDDGRVFQPEYADYFYKQPIPEGIAIGHTVTIEVWQRATTMQDYMNPQILCYSVLHPTVGTPSKLVYGVLVFDDSQGKLVYLDESFYPSEPAPDMVGQFTDVFVTDYYADPVLWAIEKEITTGTTETTFSPGSTCTNAQILTFLWRAYGCPEAAIENPFSNLTGDEYYYEAALWAYEKGMVSAPVFDADASCTRSATVRYLWQAAGKPEPSSLSSFADVPADADYATAVSWAVEQDITNGTSDTTFSPDQICSRGQIVTFLYRNLA